MRLFEKYKYAFVLLASLGLHLCIYHFLVSIPQNKASLAAKPPGTRITLRPGKGPKPGTQKSPRSQRERLQNLPKQNARTAPTPNIPVPSIRGKKPPSAKANPPSVAQSNLPSVAKNTEKHRSHWAPTPSPDFSPKLKHLLPKNDFLNDQMQYGKNIAMATESAGEGWDTQGDGFSTANDVVIQEFSLLAYFEALDRLFSNTWGPYRVLPPDSKFYGIAGESIDYIFVVNRDGSLNKMINVSSQSQPNRDFSAVDNLVTGVVRNVFPLQPIPGRIVDEPLILKKKIRFVGYRFGIF